MNYEVQRYFNRELSWLEFNQRVLDEAVDETVPSLERLKFLAITASNLDEFFMIRVGGLQLLARRANAGPDPSDMSTDEQLKAVSERTQRMTAEQYYCYLQSIEPALARAGIRRLQPADLSEKQALALEQVFRDEVHAVLSPMAVHSTDEFPLLLNQTLSVCVRLKALPESEATSRFAIIPFGRAKLRFLTLPSDGGYDYMLLEDAVAKYIDRFFPGEEVLECVPFRITRNADLSIREELTSDLLEEMEELLAARREGNCVRLEMSDRVTTETRLFLQNGLGVNERDVYATPGPLDLAAFMSLSGVQGLDSVRYEPWPPRASPAVDPTETMFDVISRRDLLLCHPYETFEPVIRLIEEAADDPQVMAIKQTLYRTSDDSPIVKALMRAATRGKYVTVIVELKARFDEARNIEWARSLEHAGVQVIYGVKGLKTHAKLCIIVRREAHGTQRYVHFGTGNYNENTARLYSDISFMTSNEELGEDATSFFNAITGYSQPQRFRKLEAAPIGLRETLLEMIQTETRRKEQGQRAGIMAKLNSLVDPQLIDALYAASQAGVRIRLNIRGICCLRPGVKGLSENITVTSIVDRFLEHSRIVYFYHGGDEHVFISSADWMPRNLDRRVELLVPIEDKTCRDRLIEVLELYFKDNVKARKLRPDGSYTPLKTSPGTEPIRSQEVLYRRASEAIQEAEHSRRTVFEPHRAPGNEE